MEYRKKIYENEEHAHIPDKSVVICLQVLIAPYSLLRYMPPKAYERRRAYEQAAARRAYDT